MRCGPSAEIDWFGGDQGRIRRDRSRGFTSAGGFSELRISRTCEEEGVGFGRAHVVLIICGCCKLLLQNSMRVFRIKGGVAGMGGATGVKKWMP